MPDATQGSSYVVYNFADLQLDLENYLNEDADLSGNWETAEKQRQLNHGLVQVAARTFTPKDYKEESFQASPDEPVGHIAPPSNMLKPVRLFVTQAPNTGTKPSSQNPFESAHQYNEVPEEDFFDIRRGKVSRAGGAPHRGYSFWYDEAKRQIRFTQDVTANAKYELYYVRVPNKMVNDGDVVDVNPVYAYLAAVWAAGRLLYRDQEHKDKGRSLLRDFEAGIADFQAQKFKEAGRKHVAMKLDPRTFKHSRDNAHRGNFSADDHWLRWDA